MILSFFIKKRPKKKKTHNHTKIHIQTQIQLLHMKQDRILTFLMGGNVGVDMQYWSHFAYSNKQK